jgi:hypothetical protein
VNGCTGLCKLLFDWQTLVAGLLALVSAIVAGVLAYVAGLRQVAEIRRQNQFLQRSESRRLARGVVSAARIVEGILKTIDDKIRAPTFAGGLSTDIGVAATNQIRQSIQAPPHHELIGQLQYLGREVIDNYFLLCVKIEEFQKRSGSATAGALQDELKSLLAIVDHLRDEIEKESKQSLAILAG